MSLREEKDMFRQENRAEVYPMWNVCVFTRPWVSMCRNTTDLKASETNKEMDVGHQHMETHPLLHKECVSRRLTVTSV